MSSGRAGVQALGCGFYLADFAVAGYVIVDGHPTLPPASISCLQRDRRLGAVLFRWVTIEVLSPRLSVSLAIYAYPRHSTDGGDRPQ